MERLIAEFEKFQSKIKQAEVRFDRVGQMQQQLAELETAATSPDRTVTVVAGPGGVIKDIQFTPDALRRPPGALSAMIMSTLNAAVADAARKQAGVVDENMGGALGNVNVTDQVLQAQAEAMGTTVEDLKSKMTEEGSVAADTSQRQDDYHDAYDDEEIGGASVFEDTGSNQPPPATGGASRADDFLNNLLNDDDEGYRR